MEYLNPVLQEIEEEATPLQAVKNLLDQDPSLLDALPRLQAYAKAELAKETEYLTNATSSFLEYMRPEKFEGAQAAVDR
jgi:hypothetical protein